MRKLKSILLVPLAMIAAISLGCSHQTRTVNAKYNYSDILNNLTQIQTESSGSGQMGSAGTQFFNLLNNGTSAVYYSEGPGPMGEVVSVFSAVYYDFLGADMKDLTFEDIEEVRIAFVWEPSTGESALMLDFKLVGSGTFVTKYFAGSQGSVSGGEFAGSLMSDSGYEIILRSFDVNSDGDLKGVIQLRLSDFDASGEEVDNGKFSTLLGFGG